MPHGKRVISNPIDDGWIPAIALLVGWLLAEEHSNKLLLRGESERERSSAFHESGSGREKPCGKCRERDFPPIQPRFWHLFSLLGIIRSWQVGNQWKHV